jgi:hypothetical protein
MRNNKNAVTLIELMLGIAFLSVVVLSIGSLSYFSNFQAMNTDRRARLQNLVSITVEHMQKEISKAAGNEIALGADSVINTSTVSGNTALKVYVDSGTMYGATGIYSPGDGKSGGPADRLVAYRFTGGAILPATDRYQIWFCPECTDPPACGTCNPVWGTATNIVSGRISELFTYGNIANLVITKPGSPGALNSNTVGIQIKACWNPADPAIIGLADGTVDNPCITSDIQISMPSVITH